MNTDQEECAAYQRAVVLAQNEIDELRRRAEQAEALALTLQQQRDQAEAQIMHLQQSHHNAWVLVGRCDYFLETYAAQPARVQRAQAAKLRAEIKEASGT